METGVWVLCGGCSNELDRGPIALEFDEGVGISTCVVSLQNDGCCVWIESVDKGTDRGCVRIMKRRHRHESIHRAQVGLFDLGGDLIDEGLRQVVPDLSSVWLQDGEPRRCLPDLIDVGPW